MSVADIWARYAGRAVVDHSDEEAFDDLHYKGGFSRHAVTGEVPEKGYMVSLHNDRGGEELVKPLAKISPQDIADHRVRAQQDASDHRIHQGGWVHGDDAYLDRSINVEDRDEAMNLGRWHKQRAIYDVKNQTDIPLDH